MCYLIRHPLLKALLLVGFGGTLLLGWATMGSTTWAQPERPTLTPVPTSTDTPGPTVTPTATAEPGPTSIPAAQPQAGAGPAGPNLIGRVINVTTDEPEESVTVVFTTGDVSVETVTDKDGKYAFTLGTANGILNAIPPAGSGLQAVTSNVAVRPQTGVETVVNLGVSPAGNGAPPLIPRVSLAPDWVSAGQYMTITVLVKNTFPQAISGAMVTNWLPDRLIPVSIHSSTGNPYFSDRLAIVELGHLDAGSGALVEIVAQLASGQAAATTLQGKVSFFYRDDAAAQAQALGSSNGAAPSVLPVTGMGIPLLGLALIVVVVIVGWLRRRVSRAVPT